MVLHRILLHSLLYYKLFPVNPLISLSGYIGSFWLSMHFRMSVRCPSPEQMIKWDISQISYGWKRLIFLNPTFQLINYMSCSVKIHVFATRLCFTIFLLCKTLLPNLNKTRPIFNLFYNS